MAIPVRSPGHQVRSSTHTSPSVYMNCIRRVADVRNLKPQNMCTKYGLYCTSFYPPLSSVKGLHEGQAQPRRAQHIATGQFESQSKRHVLRWHGFPDAWVHIFETRNNFVIVSALVPLSHWQAM